ncbi:SGNH/GDSL hydrolase family protein [Halobacillus sp. Marseille-P3879]|uniref:SGNH/GDSL hydrolase family protein n=1 Tax=Halobacillus TaxID=45667 RepID=UPI000C7AE1D8|nr:SGNH/GDSL hydrolase family protein [Halobacillus sp. Marseille-P3879]
MKKILLVFCFVFFLQNIQPYFTQADSRQLTAIGDSIPYGYNLSKDNHDPSEKAFPYTIGEQAGLEVTNLGIPGLTSEELLKAVKHNDIFRDTIRESDYIVLYIGGNDLLNLLKKHKGVKGIDMDEAAIVVRNLLFNVYSIIMELDQLTDGKILVYNIYNPYPEEGKSLDRPLQYINTQYSSLIKLLSHFTEVRLVNAYKAFKGHPEYILKDDVHPTAEGQIVLANLGLKKLKK